MPVKLADVIYNKCRTKALQFTEFSYNHLRMLSMELILLYYGQLAGLESANFQGFPTESNAPNK